MKHCGDTSVKKQVQVSYCEALGGYICESKSRSVIVRHCGDTSVKASSGQ